jgi:hypothetical protein
MLMELDILPRESKYISAGRASNITGYSSDYIGQLCRSGRIQGKLVGRAWYVYLPDILEHKKTRQLGRRSHVSIKSFYPSEEEIPTLKSIQQDKVPIRSEFSYESDARPLLPILNTRMKSVSGGDSAGSGYVIAVAASFFLIIAIGYLAPSLSPTLSASKGTSHFLFKSLSSSFDFAAKGFNSLRNVAAVSSASYPNEMPLSSYKKDANEQYRTTQEAQEIEPFYEAYFEESYPDSLVFSGAYESMPEANRQNNIKVEDGLYSKILSSLSIFVEQVKHLVKSSSERISAAATNAAEIAFTFYEGRIGNQ